MSGGRGCECGSGADCFPVWHAALAEEQSDPTMAAWHNPLVCGFVLQHPSLLQPRFADGQFRFSSFSSTEASTLSTPWLGQGQRAIAGALRLRPGGARELRADPTTGFPAAFAVSLRHVREPGGGFVGDGYAAYDERIAGLRARDR